MLVCCKMEYNPSTSSIKSVVAFFGSIMALLILCFQHSLALLEKFLFLLASKAMFHILKFCRQPFRNGFSCKSHKSFTVILQHSSLGNHWNSQLYLATTIAKRGLAHLVRSERTHGGCATLVGLSVRTRRLTAGTARVTVFFSFIILLPPTRGRMPSPTPPLPVFILMLTAC